MSKCSKNNVGSPRLGIAQMTIYLAPRWSLPPCTYGVSLSGILPVSYTHLDVYKRQCLYQIFAFIYANKLS